MPPNGPAAASPSRLPAAAGTVATDLYAFDVPEEPFIQERAAAWAETMGGFDAAGALRSAHEGSRAKIGAVTPLRREAREELEDRLLAPGATRARGGGERLRPEAPDEFRTAFERDRDRVLHSPAFRRLAGKTQVFVFPRDHQRTRLTHALEVAQVARSLAASLGLNVALAEAIALGHDCGHGPGGHASEDAFTPYLEGGFDHAVFGADVALASLNLTAEVADGIRNHSWSRPAPRTPEGEVVSWADRIAYVCHDFEDAVSAGVVAAGELPAVVRERCGSRRSDQLGAFVDALVTTSAAAGEVLMPAPLADGLAEFRRFNYERVYLREESVAQAASVIAVLRALVEYFASRPQAMAGALPADADDTARTTAAVSYVAGMTDRYAFDLAVERLGWPIARLPRGVDVPGGRRA